MQPLLAAAAALSCVTLLIHQATQPLALLGLQVCLDINECLSISQLDPKCTCERCACNNTRGGYE